MMSNGLKVILDFILTKYFLYKMVMHLFDVFQSWVLPTLLPRTMSQTSQLKTGQSMEKRLGK